MLKPKEKACDVIFREYLLHSASNDSNEAKPVEKIPPKLKSPYLLHGYVYEKSLYFDERPSMIVHNTIAQPWTSKLFRTILDELEAGNFESFPYNEEAGTCNI